MKEDDLTKKLISGFEEMYRVCEVKTEPEKHYNYYGSRGIVDLYVEFERDGGKESHLFEVKSNLKNANEVLRQFNKMKTYFYKDPDKNRPVRRTYELCVVPTIENYRHLVKYKDIYSQAYEREFSSNYLSILTFRHPENISPVQVKTLKFGIGEENWWEHCKISNKMVFNALKTVKPGTVSVL